MYPIIKGGGYGGGVGYGFAGLPRIPTKTSTPPALLRRDKTSPLGKGFNFGLSGSDKYVPDVTSLYLGQKRRGKSKGFRTGITPRRIAL